MTRRYILAVIRPKANVIADSDFSMGELEITEGGTIGF